LHKILRLNVRLSIIKIIKLSKVDALNSSILNKGYNMLLNKNYNICVAERKEYSKVTIETFIYRIRSRDTTKLLIS